MKFVILSLFICINGLLAGTVEKPEEDKSVKAELAKFKIAEGYEVNLFASEKDGIANPVTMRWDARGRLWVLCTWIYPQVKPAAKADDKLLILEDTDNDGRADKTTVYADGLHMPMGFALGEGGVYIAAGRELLHFRDTDGDDKADEKKIILTGFGTGDTHQNANSFTWSPGGELHFCQGLHSFSRVETPWGIRRLDEHGSWRFRPRRKQLDAFSRSCGGGNPWGIAFGKWGEPFIKSNGTQLEELLPSMVHNPHVTKGWGGAEIGRTKIKSMIVHIVESPHFPEDMQGDILIAGYMANDVNRMGIAVEGSGHKSVNKENLLSSKSKSFRPVDIQEGPRGALYIADWYNPIIGHYQASLRHPDRDKSHGRIWRITAKGRPLVKKPQLVDLKITGLLEKLSSNRGWERYHAKRLLTEKETPKVVAAVEKWADIPSRTEHELFEAVSLLESHEVVNEKLLARLLNAKEYRARAYAARVVGRWSDRISNPLNLLEKCIKDDKPRVRLEAIVAATDVNDSRNVGVILQAIDKPQDRFIRHALDRALIGLQSKWQSDLLNKKITFKNRQHLIFALRKTGGELTISLIEKLLTSADLDKDSLRDLSTLMVEFGSSQQLKSIFDTTENPQVLAAFLRRNDANQNQRTVKPSGSLKNRLQQLLGYKNPAVQIQAVNLAASWKVSELLPKVKGIVDDSSQNTALRGAAVIALARMSGAKSTDKLKSIKGDKDIRLAVMKALLIVDVSGAAGKANELLKEFSDKESIKRIVLPFAKIDNGIKQLTKAFEKKKPAAATASAIRNVLIENGHSLTTDLRKVLIEGKANLVGVPAYSTKYVADLVKEIKTDGNIAKGKGIYHSSKMTCIGCHKMNGVGGILGPDLSAVGRALSTELIVESFLWPDRQLKEGYISKTVTTKDGQVLTGNIHSNDRTKIVLKEVITGKLSEIYKKNIKSETKPGTIMPPGLAAALTREELRDVIAYLSQIK